MRHDASVHARHARVAPLLSACAVLLVAAPADAQTAQPRPPTREEVERPLPPQPDRRPRLTVEAGIERAPCALDEPAYRDIRFTLHRVSIGGLRGLAEADIAPAWADMVGRELPLSAVCTIRDRAATILRERGYIASVEIPEQRLTGGELRLEALVARLAAVRVRGDAGRAERTIARYLEKLLGREAFNRFEAERYLLLVRDLPGYDVRLALRSAGAARGEVIGDVTVERRAAEIDANVQNWGSRDLGRWGALVRGQLFGLTGLGDRTTLAAFTTADFQEQQTLQLAHDFRVGGEGLSLGAQFTYAWSEPDTGDPAFRLRAKTLIGTVEAGYPLIRSEAANLAAGVGLDFVDQRVGLNGLVISRDELRVAWARLDFDRIDPASLRRASGYNAAEPRWRIGGRAEIRRGLGILGATRPCGAGFAACLAPGAVPPSRLEGDPTATVLRVEGAAELRPLPRLTIAAAARAQASDGPLLSFEEFSAGNYTIGRGYDPGTLIGDRGIGARLEIRHGSIVPPDGRSFALEPFLFLDAARVGNADRAFPVDTARSLSSVGGGVRAALGYAARLEAMLAVPLERAGLENRRGGPRLLLSLTTRLWPWRLR